MEITTTENTDMMDDITTRYEEVKDQTTEEYFEGNKFSIDAFEKKYALTSDETYVKALKRVCDYVASVEKTPKQREYWSSRWFDEIYNDWWHPAGSIMQGAGSEKKISLANCVTLSLGSLRDDEEWDNLESIIKNTAYEVAKSAAYRQGLGVDFSRLRPEGTAVSNSARISTGAIHWMKFIDSIGYYVGQAGRVPALLFSITISHPDVEKFITIKKDYTQIQNANISVQITDNFYDAVKNDEEWALSFEIPEVKKGDKIWVDVHSTDMDCKQDGRNGRWYKIATHNKKAEKIKKSVKARELLELIAKNMCSNAEPGIQNIDVARKYSNSDYLYDPKDILDSRILSTNACSEQFLSRNSCCILSSINMGRFSALPEIYFKQLERIGLSIQRFLDNVNECELRDQTHATPHQRLAIEKLRRTGAGVTNICAWLFKKNLIYGSKEGNEAVEEFLKYYNYWLYVGGEKTGEEKGSFGMFDSKKWKSAPFVNRVIEESKKIAERFKSPEITGNYSRNVTYSSIAPCGTLSLGLRESVMSYGIEPAFFLYYWKRTRMAGKYEYYFTVPRIVRDMYIKAGCPIPIRSDTIIDDWQGTKGKQYAEYIDRNREKVGIKFKDSTQIDPLDKLDLMSRAMKWVDSSISTTYMLPEGSDWKDVYNFILKAHEKEIKSIAAFPDKKMYGIVSSISFKDLALKLQKEGVEMHHQNFSDEELKELNMSRETIQKQVFTAPKRLNELDADIHVVTVKGEKFVIVIGIQNNEPYEIFGGHLNGLGLKTNFKKGKLAKVRRRQYSLEFDDVYIEDFSKQFTPTEQILFRMASTSLRHGVPIKYIVEQLHKATEDITSMASAAGRVLKKYIKDGEEATGQICPNCGQKLIYIDGCVSCVNCGHSKCG